MRSTTGGCAPYGLTGAARLRAYSPLDIDISQNQAPWASLRVPNTASSSVDASTEVGRLSPSKDFIYNVVALK